MANDRTNFVVVFRTGQIWQIDVAMDTLKKARIPYFYQAETSGGLRTAMPIAVVPGPGQWFCLLVPESAVEKARLTLSELPFEIKTNPDVWDFKPAEGVKKL